jgi:hypothetical protein
MPTTPCPLCLEPAAITRVEDHDQYTITCARCVGFTMSGPLMRVVELARERGNQQVLERLSDLAAATHASGGNLNLTTDNWEVEALTQRLKHTEPNKA